MADHHKLLSPRFGRNVMWRAAGHSNSCTRVVAMVGFEPSAVAGARLPSPFTSGLAATVGTLLTAGIHSCPVMPSTRYHQDDQRRVTGRRGELERQAHHLHGALQPALGGHAAPPDDMLTRRAGHLHGRCADLGTYVTYITYVTWGGVQILAHTLHTLCVRYMGGLADLERGNPISTRTSHVRYIRYTYVTWEVCRS